jgi:O-antigen ligase
MRAPNPRLANFEVSHWLALGVLPLAIAPGWFIGHDVSPKLLLLGVAAAITLFSSTQWMPGLGAAARHPLGRMYLLGVSLWIVSLCLSSALSSDPAVSFTGTTWRRFGLVTQLCVALQGVACCGYYVSNPDRRSAAVLPLLLSGVAAASFGILQSAGRDPLLDAQFYTLEYNHLIRPPATFGHAMYFAAWLAPIVILAGSRAARETRARDRWTNLAVASLSLLALLQTGSRSAILGVAAGTALLAVRRLQLRRVAGVCAAGLAVGLLAATVTAAAHALPQTVSRWRDDPGGGPRLRLWQESLSLIASHPWIGGGPETFAGNFRAVQSSGLSSAYPDYYSESPHNLILEVACGQGLLGIAALGLLFGAAICSGVASPIDLAGSAALFAMLVAAQFIPLSLPNALGLFSIGGVLVASRITTTVKETSRFRLLSLVGGLPLAVMVAWPTVQDWRSARTAEEIARGNLDSARSLYRSVCALPFAGPGQDLWLSRQFAVAAQRLPGPPGATALQLARLASARAESHAEDAFNAYFQSAALAIAAGDMVDGERKLRSATLLAPNWYRPRFLLAQLLILAGRAHEGAQEAAIAIRVAGSHAQEIERTAHDLGVTMEAGR